MFNGKERTFIDHENRLMVGFSSQQLELRPTKDPIVFYKVPRGAIIIAAWGEEAGDELVLNQQLN